MLSGGVRDLRAELSGLRLSEFTVRGGVDHLVLQLGEPEGRVPVRFHGGVTRLTLVRHERAALSLSTSGGATQVQLDELYLPSVGGGLAWRSEADPSEGYYDVQISGGVCELVVTTLTPRLSSPHPERRSDGSALSL